MRKCKICGLKKPKSDFHKYKSTSSKGITYENLRTYCIDCERKKELQRYYASTADKKARMRERNRESAAARRRREGKPVRKIVNGAYGAARTGMGGNAHADNLPWKPMLNAIKASGLTFREVAARTGLSERTFKRSEELGYVTIYTADAMCIGIDTHLNFVYPELADD